MTQFQVDSEAVLATTGAVRTIIDTIRSSVSSLDGHLGTLQGAWTGQAATAFQGVATDWRGTQQRLEESLTAINGALTHAAQQYAEIEAANARLFAR
jgi:WXG100 family type VII secretion target